MADQQVLPFLLFLSSLFAALCNPGLAYQEDRKVRCFRILFLLSRCVGDFFFSIYNVLEMIGIDMYVGVDALNCGIYCLLVTRGAPRPGRAWLRQLQFWTDFRNAAAYVAQSRLRV